jgi:Lon protease-like protein
MSELGLFPLPLVLVPTERLPLHIFEPRYRDLIGECIELDSEFGLVLEDPDGSLSEIGTRAAVVEVLEQLPDGRLNVVIEGHERFRLVELTDGRSFITATVEPVLDDAEPADEAESERAAALFAELADVAGSEVDAPSSDTPDLDFRIAARIAFEADAKQELLGTTSPRRRMALVVELLEQSLTTIRLQSLLRQRASTNGKVHPPEIEP